MNPVYGWLTEASSEQKRALLAAFLGYMLDSMDVMLYALVLGQVQRDLHLSAALSGAHDVRNPGCCRVRWHDLRLVCRPVRAGARAHLQCTGLFHRHGAVRLYANGRPTADLPRVPGARHGWGMGCGRRPGCRDVAGAPPRQGARAGAKRLGSWLRGGCSRGWAGDAPLRLARCVLRRYSARLDLPLGTAWAARAGDLASGAEFAAHFPVSSSAARSVTACWFARP